MNSKLARAFLAMFVIATSLPAAAGLLSSPRPITYVDESNTRHIYAFARGGDGHLHAAHFDGTSWSWIDHGLPPDATSVHDPQPIMYVDRAGTRRFNILAVDNNGRLVMRHSSASGWQWRIQGGPALKKVVGGLSAVTYLDEENVRRFYVFGIRQSDSHLVVNWLVGSNWQWADQGVPGAAFCEKCPIASVSAITFKQAGQRNIHAYVRTQHPTESHGGSIAVNTWRDNDGWLWETLPSAYSTGRVAALTFLDEYLRRNIYVFRGQSSPDASNRGFDYFAGREDIPNWNPPHYSDGAEPPHGLELDGLVSQVSAVWHQEVNWPRPHVFLTFNGRLYMAYAYAEDFNGWYGNWYWNDLGAPADFSVQNPEAIAFVGAGNVHEMYVFVRAYGRTEKIQAAHWNGIAWQWLDLGTP
jgi:hypothetical protein